MVDNFGTPVDSPTQTVETADSRPGFLGTTGGKLVAGSIVLLAVLGALAAIAYLFIFGRSSNVVVQPQVPVAQTTSTVDGAVEASPTVRPEPPLEDTFAFRNIFQPTIRVTLSADPDAPGGVAGGGTGAGGVTNPDGSSVDVPADTLYLATVSTVDGDRVAELVWNGQTYSLREGETISGTPWKVLSISGDTVVMLYGDTRVTLTVGQGITK